MKTPSKMVYDLLVAAKATLGLGDPNTGQDWAIYRDIVPSQPHRVVAVFATPPPPIDTSMSRDGSYVDSSYVQIQVRGISREEVETRINLIRDYLVCVAHKETETEGGRTAEWQAIRSSGGAFMSGDMTALFIATQNVQTIRTVSGVIT